MRDAETCKLSFPRTIYPPYSLSSWSICVESFLSAPRTIQQYSTCGLTAQ